MASASTLSSGLKGVQSLAAMGSADVLKIGSKTLLAGMMHLKSPNTTRLAARVIDKIINKTRSSD
jgi:hypothetical protein